MPKSKKPLGEPVLLDGIASTKLEPQACNERHVRRSRLLALVDDLLRHRLTLVQAGAGYGKTSLLMQWLNALRARQVTLAWVTLEEDESSASACLAHIVAACVRVGYVGADLLAALKRPDEKLPLRSLITAFINSLAQRSERLVIFLDEYNRAQSVETTALLRSLVRNLPRHVHLVVASRWRPEIDIEHLRAQGDLLEVAAEQLRFSRDEVGELLASSGVALSGDAILRLTDRTEGWPIALQMARLWLGGNQERARLVSDFSGRTADLAFYLTEQVLSELPEDEQTFLMQTSVLDQVNGDLANAITGRNDGWLVMERLYERNLFLIPESDERTWFRYHALFLEFLRDRNRRLHGPTMCDLDHKAAVWFNAHGMLKQAVHHALRAGQHQLAARMLVDAGGWRLIMDGRMTVLRAAIEALPESLTRNDPALALAQVFLLIKDGDIGGARHAFADLDAIAPDRWSEGDLTDRQIIDHILTDYADDRPSLAEIDSLQVLRQDISRHDHVVQAILSDSVAAKYYEFGLIPQCLEACDDAIMHYRVLGSLYGEVFLRFTQAKCHLARGQLDEAETVLRQTEKELRLRFGNGVELSAHTAIYLAEVLVERGRIDEAAALLDGALPVAETSDGWFELYAAGYTAAAAVGWAQGGLDSALAVWRRARQMAETRRLDRLGLLADCGCAQYLCQADRNADARLLLPRLARALERNNSQHVDRLATMVAARIAGIFLQDGRIEEAARLLTAEIERATSENELRRLIELRLLLAQAMLASGDLAAAAELVDKAVHDGLFSGMRRVYLDRARPLRTVIEHVLCDRAVLSPDRYRDNFLRDIRRELRRTERRQAEIASWLKPGELEVLRELDHGFSNKEIANHLGISPDTVKYRMKNLFARLGVSTRAAAVKMSREQSLLSPDDANPR